MFCLNGDIVMVLLLFSTHRFLFLSFSRTFFSCLSHFISHVKPVLFTPFPFLHCPSFAFVFNFISFFLIFLVTFPFLHIFPLASIFLSFQTLSLHRYWLSCLPSFSPPDISPSCCCPNLPKTGSTSRPCSGLLVWLPSLLPWVSNPNTDLPFLPFSTHFSGCLSQGSFFFMARDASDASSYTFAQALTSAWTALYPICLSLCLPSTTLPPP